MGLEIANVVITSFLTAIIIAVTIWLGIKQNDLQRQDQKISLFEKRYEVYLIFEELVHNTKALKDTYSTEKFLKNTNEDLLSAFKNACVSKIGSKTGEKIRLLDDLKLKSYFGLAGEQSEVYGKIKNLEKELIFTALSELDDKITILKRSEFLFKKEISDRIIEFSQDYYIFLEICIARHKDRYADEYNKLVDDLMRLQPFRILEEIKQILNLDKYNRKVK